MRNYVSPSILGHLLYHTARINLLTLEPYPALQESWEKMSTILPWKFAQRYPKIDFVSDTMRVTRQLETVCFSPDLGC